MEIRILKELAQSIGKADLTPYFTEKEYDRLLYNSYLTLDISHFSKFKLLQLKNLLTDHSKLRGAKGNIRDITAWLQGLQDAGGTKCSTAQQFATVVERYLANVPGHRIYEKDNRRSVWFAFYVGYVEYNPPERTRWGFTPANTVLTLFYESMGKVTKDSRTFYREDVRGMTAHEALVAKGMVPENEELRSNYLKETENFRGWVMSIGKQFLARGEATDDLDGNEKKDNGWWWRSTNSLLLDKDGVPARVVCDVFNEEDNADDQNDSSDDADIDHDCWLDKVKSSKDLDDDEKKVDTRKRDAKKALAGVEDQEDETSVGHREEIPVHPFMAAFDLRRHMRLKVHVGQLEEYIYDPQMGDKLVLPDTDRELVDVLLAEAKEDQFRDIIAGKGGGYIIMCAGIPGTGKTLTAEVYAEVAQRPLYSVQCSQLGTTADELEDELLKVLARGARWGAITLLDEADVYVAERGRDLAQNAIVGVFLRVLEYYKGVMFLTTNRPEMVDDAVLSRCVARIIYTVPKPKDQARIWRILADVSSVKLSDAEIKKIIAKYNNLTGRDIKNLVKLSSLVATSKTKGVVSAETVEFVKRFKPTQDAGKEQGDG